MHVLQSGIRLPWPLIGAGALAAAPRGTRVAHFACTPWSRAAVLLLYVCGAATPGGAPEAVAGAHTPCHKQAPAGELRQAPAWLEHLQRLICELRKARLAVSGSVREAPG